MGLEPPSHESMSDAPGDWLTGAPKAAAVAVGALLVGLGAWRLLEREAAHPGGAAGTPVTVASLRASAQEASRADVLDLNAATAAELELLPGIGPSAAERIVAYRDQIGGFHSVEELDGVKGIGTRTMERLRPLVRVAVPDRALSEAAPAPD